MKTVIFNQYGKIVGHGTTAPELLERQLEDMENEFCIAGVANRDTQKVIFECFENGRPVNPKIVDKTKKDIAADAVNKKIELQSRMVPVEDRRANITKGQLQAILQRLDELETRVEK